MSDDKAELREDCAEILNKAASVFVEEAAPEFVAAVQLAKAWLAEHPVDDDEPIDADWLWSSGFETSPEKEYMRIMVSKDTYPTYLMICIADEYNGFQTCFSQYELDKIDVSDADTFMIASNPGTMKTRGDVRRLCRALGIQLTENAKGSE